MSVTVTIDSNTLRVEPGTSIFDAARSAGIFIPSSCGGVGRCRECLVQICQGLELASPPAPEEAGLPEGMRLACRTQVIGKEGVLELETPFLGVTQIELGDVARPQLERFDPAVRRSSHQVFVEGHPVAVSTRSPLGLAIDLGTTTVVLQLLNLETFETLSSVAFQNPQRFAGSDVMSRIAFDGQNPGLQRKVLLSYLRHHLRGLPCEARDIFEIVVAGNTTMRDLLFGVDVQPIGQKPFRSVIEAEWRAGTRSTTHLCVKAEELGLPVHPAARVLSLPLLGCHVGADTAACILASGMDKPGGRFALVDIGTNTEVVIRNGDLLVAASCPAGPAFEGGLISCGLPALNGAVERVRLGDDGEVDFRVIGGGVPTGFCGSGLVDALGELRRTGRMSDRGRLADPAQAFSLPGHPAVRVTERDISVLAQAKAATASGLRILLSRAGLSSFSQLDRLYLCGAFGRHLDLEAAKRIGLIPDLPEPKFVKMGNASVRGAVVALLSVSKRAELEAALRDAAHVELEEDPDFFDWFVEGCFFSPLT